MSDEDEYFSVEEYNEYIKEVRQLYEKLKKLPPTDITVVGKNGNLSVSIEGSRGIIKSVGDWITINTQVMESFCDKVKKREEAIAIGGLITLQIDNLMDMKEKISDEVH